MKNAENKTNDNGFYTIWLREERHSEYRIPKSEISSLALAKDLVRTQVEKSADFFVDDYIETWGESTCQLTDCLRDDPSNEIFDAYEDSWSEE
tara:strand:+ start:349 stop:627 length:279 start_codon:yes stop_codon:yes gene_type:complete